MKKFLPFILAGVIIIFGLLFLFLKNKKTAQQPQENTTPSPIIVAIEDRPYVTLTPRADGHELKLQITNLKGVQTVEYELVYLTGEVSRGVIGSVDLKGETSLVRDLLLGSCSKNVCKYDEGVSEGTLTLRLRGSGTQKYDLAFHLQQGNEAKKKLASNDENFNFQGSLSSPSFYLTMETFGIPQKPSGKIISSPYGIFTSGSAQAKGTIVLILKESLPEVKVLGWDGATKTWKEYQKGIKIEGKTVSVEVDLLTTFVAVAP